MFEGCLILLKQEIERGCGRRLKFNFYAVLKSSGKAIGLIYSCNRQRAFAGQNARSVFEGDRDKICRKRKPKDNWFGVELILEEDSDPFMPGVKISTFHTGKCLEFDVVIIHGLDGQFHGRTTGKQRFHGP